MTMAPARRSFYDGALSEADRAGLDRAREIAGIDEEVALLRVLLRRAIDEHGDDLQLIQGGVRLLMRSLIAQHRVTEKQAGNLSQAITNVLDEFGEVLRGASDDPA